MSEETRRAPAAFAFQDASGAFTARGQGEAVIADDGLSVGAVTVMFLDADTLRADDYRIEIGCWPAGTLLLNQLGRRFDTFTAELRRSRNQARVAGLLAHGVAMPTRFPAAVLGESSSRPVECQVYDTHITLVPEDGRPMAGSARRAHRSRKDGRAAGRRVDHRRWAEPSSDCSHVGGMSFIGR